ncbi:MAG: hypothetical protein N4A35_03075 [Flavobacteriales bacterium]|jgi:predicted SnoaL-like aldol condensation-catalyzing enzyme|nr:hypothetical protein [Flavobacteriales bacterium]
MSKKLENAKGLYLKGIKEGNVDVVDIYTGSRYTQHSTGVADGTEGFKSFFKGFLERTNERDIQIIRAIEDGNYVFVHVFQDIDNGAAKWITTDLFNTDENDKIVEHWDVIAPYREIGETKTGNDVIFGEFKIEDHEKTAENKALVRMYLTDVFQNRNAKNLGEYISKEQFIEHNANRSSGFENLESFIKNEDFNYDFVFKVMGQGNYVVAFSKVIHNMEEICIFDIFRVENGKIVEHWDNMEPIPPRSEWANTGKF